MRATVFCLLAWLLSAALPRPIAPAEPPPGRVRIDGRAVADDRGPFVALGASLFWAAWGFRHDRHRLDSHLALLSRHEFDYIRALGVVGRQPYWSGREIDWRWPDYKDVIAGLTDLAYDRYGLRVEWTLFADGDQVIPEAADRFRLIDTFLAMARGREHKIMHFEIANESWQNGFSGADGIAQIRELAAYLAARTDIPVAVSDSLGQECADHLELYADLPVDILTEHFSRDVGGRLGRWGPVIAPWSLKACTGLPAVVSSNEPIGPDSSVASENDPFAIIAGAISTYMAGAGLYVFHTGAGVWGRERLSTIPNATRILEGFAAMKRYLPADIANWTGHRHDSTDRPVIPYAGGTAGSLRADEDGDGAAELLASVQGQTFVVVPIGIVHGVTLEARRAMEFDVLHPLTGERLEHHALRRGQQITLPSVSVLVLKGEFTDRTR